MSNVLRTVPLVVALKRKAVFCHWRHLLALVPRVKSQCRSFITYGYCTYMNFADQDLHSAVETRDTFTLTRKHNLTATGFVCS